MATNPSIVDFLNKQGKSSSFASRAKLAAQYGIANYTGAADQNTKLLGILSGQQSTDSPKYSSADASSVSQPLSTYNPDLTINKVTTSVTTRQLSDGTVERLDPITGRRIALYSSPQEESAAIKKEVAAQEAERDARKLPPAPTPMPTSMSLDPTPQQTGGQSSSSDFMSIIKDLIQGMNNAGYMLNPNKSITPQDAADFLAHLQQNASVFLPEAQRQIAPYYQTQLATALDQFKTNIGLVPQQYAQDIRTLGEQFAEKGMAQSGRRIEAENLATQQYQQVGGQAAKQFAQEYGTAQLPTAPNINAPSPTGDRSLPVYQLSDSVYSGLQGKQEFQKETDVQKRARDLESGYRSYNQPMTRQLTFS